ncbi:hypothetical protein PINS_up023170 [Pythium insidiosum]|nr:hypothetical protein PINS_up023170 [Pythium insidiosum]
MGANAGKLMQSLDKSGGLRLTASSQTTADTNPSALVLGAGAALLCAIVAMVAWRKTTKPTASTSQLHHDVYIQLTT